MKKIVNIKYVAAVTALAFLWSALLPFFAVYDSSSIQALASTSAESSPLPGKKMLICTPDGFKWIDVSELQNTDEQPEPHPQFKCALCYVTSYGLKFTAPCESLVSVYLLSFQHVTFHIDEKAPVNLFRFDRAQSRAPPSQV